MPRQVGPLVHHKGHRMFLLLFLACQNKYVEQEPVRFNHVVKFLINEGNHYTFYYNHDNDTHTPLEVFHYGQGWSNSSHSVEWSMDNEDQDPYVIVHWSWWQGFDCKEYNKRVDYSGQDCVMHSSIELHTAEDISTVHGGTWNHGKFGHGTIHELW